MKKEAKIIDWYIYQKNLNSGDLKLIMPLKAKSMFEAFENFKNNKSFKITARHHYVILNRDTLIGSCIWPYEEKVVKSKKKLNGKQV